MTWFTDLPTLNLKIYFFSDYLTTSNMMPANCFWQEQKATVLCMHSSLPGEKMVLIYTASLDASVAGYDL